MAAANRHIRSATNPDGQVHVFDLVNVSTSGVYGNELVSDWAKEDLDCNRVTIIFDLLLVNGTVVCGLGSGISAAGASTMVFTVPEPSTCAMALAGVACGEYSMWLRGWGGADT